MAEVALLQNMKEYLSKFGEQAMKLFPQQFLQQQQCQ